MGICELLKRPRVLRQIITQRLLDAEEMKDKSLFFRDGRTRERYIDRALDEERSVEDLAIEEAKAAMQVIDLAYRNIRNDKAADALVCYYCEGMTAEEIARSLEVGKGYVKTLITKAKRELMEKAGGE